MYQFKQYTVKSLCAPKSRGQQVSKTCEPTPTWTLLVCCFGPRKACHGMRGLDRHAFIVSQCIKQNWKEKGNKCPRHVWANTQLDTCLFVNGRLARLGLTMKMSPSEKRQVGTERERNVRVLSRVADFDIDDSFFLLLHSSSTQKFEPEIARQDNPTDTDWKIDRSWNV